MGLPVITTSQMREWEHATWAAGITESEVIQKVGQRIAERIMTLVTNERPILFLSGKGHNGDDARAASEFLSGKHHCINLSVTDPEQTLRDPLFQDLQRYAWIVDGLFGIGLNRPLNDTWQRLIQAVNGSGVPVLSVDTPSGLDADSGQILGDAIRASITLTVGAPKRGLFHPEAADRVGRLQVASDVGLIPCPLQSELHWVDGGDFKTFPPPRTVASHKGTYGHIVLFAGSMGYHGAAVLAARGALRAQPGLVTLFTPEEVYLPVASQLQAAMVHPWKPGVHVPKTTTAIVLGPGLANSGLSEHLKETLQNLWRQSPLPVIADASGLDFLPKDEIVPGALRIITPHPGEAARLLGETSSWVQSHRIETLRRLSERFHNCWVVLKGHHTLVGRTRGIVGINSSGNPFLAQGGSGDVLAGYLGGLIAQPHLQSDPEKTIRYAVWQHGAAADRLNYTRAAWTVEDLAGTLGRYRVD